MFDDAVEALVKGPGGEVAGPVVVLAVGVGEEIAAERREAGGVPRLRARPLPHRPEVIRQRAEPRLQHQEMNVADRGFMNFQLY